MLPPTRLSPARAKRLAAFLADPERPAGTLGIDSLHGFLFALLAAPENLKPSEWVPGVFAGSDAVYQDAEEMQDILGSMLALYNEVNTGILDGQPRLPKNCRPARDPLANFGPEGGLGRWANGFMLGHAYLAEAWDSATPEPLKGEVAACVYTLSYFKSREFADRLRTDQPSERIALEAEAPQLAAVFEDAMRSYAHIGRSIYQALIGVGIETVRRSEPKVGRNDPCACGSGKKFKHCCGGAGTRH